MQQANVDELVLHNLGQQVKAPWLGHFFIVRNPYTRLESFFRDKFRQDPVTKLRTYDELQRCQRSFCADLQIAPTDAPQAIREKLIGLSFAQFVHLLPKVYQQDGHLHPQVQMTTMRFRGAAVQLHFDRVLKIESVADRAYLQNVLAIDLSAKVNNTKQVAWSSPWQPTLYALVNELYQADFTTFQYEMHHD